MVLVTRKGISEHPTPTLAHTHSFTPNHPPHPSQAHTRESGRPRPPLQLSLEPGSAVSRALSSTPGVAAHLPAGSLHSARMPPSRLTPTSPASAGLRATPAPRPPPPPPSSRQCGDKAEHTHTGATRVHTRPHTRAHTHKHGESHWRAHSETHTHTRHRLQPQAKPLVQTHTLIQMYTLLHIGTHPLQAHWRISTSRHTDPHPD